MKTEARLALSLRQRRFEWALAHDEQARAAARLVAGRTHELQNLIQIVMLTVHELEGHLRDPGGHALLQDLQRTAAGSRSVLGELLAAARSGGGAIARGAPVGAAVAAAVASLREALPLEARIDAPPGAATRCTALELEHLVIGLALDAAGAPGAAGSPALALELAVRERTIEGAPWIELVSSRAAVAGGERFELRVVEAIARRAGGELATSERRGGGEDVVVALPEVA
jgi:hypothetical protein